MSHRCRLDDLRSRRQTQTGSSWTTPGVEVTLFIASMPSCSTLASRSPAKLITVPSPARVDRDLQLPLVAEHVIVHVLARSWGGSYLRRSGRSDGVCGAKSLCVRPHSLSALRPSVFSSSSSSCSGFDSSNPAPHRLGGGDHGRPGVDVLHNSSVAGLGARVGEGLSGFG